MNSSQTNRADVSVVIVCWNTCGQLRSCLTSLERAVRLSGRSVEMIVVDNASSDGSGDMVERQFPSALLVRNSSNRGFAAATNQGIGVASGRYVVLLNPDTVVHERALATLLTYADTHPEAAVVAPRLVGLDGETQLSFFPFPTISRELWRLLHLDAIAPLAVYRVPKNPCVKAVDSVQGACMLVRREVFDNSGTLDERFFMYSEEIDFCRRVRAAGGEVHWHPEAVVMHLGGQSTNQMAPQMFLELYRSKVQYFRKHFGPSGGLLYKLILGATSMPRVALAPLLALAWPSRRSEWMLISSNYRSLLATLPAL